MKCCICNKEINGHGNNPWPLHKQGHAKCCDQCNWEVRQARVYLLAGMRVKFNTMKGKSK